MTKRTRCWNGVTFCYSRSEVILTSSKMIDILPSVDRTCRAPIIAQMIFVPNGPTSDIFVSSFLIMISVNGLILFHTRYMQYTQTLSGDSRGQIKNISVSNVTRFICDFFNILHCFCFSLHCKPQ